MLAIRNGTVIDGTGAPPIAADVAIADGRIAQIGAVDTDAPELDASGLIVAPGFIDVHSHSDYTLLLDPRAVSALYQGVTTEVVGNCGHGCFPIGDPVLATRALYGYSESLPLTWRSANEYFERLSERRPGVNVLSLVPNGQLRLAVLGMQERPATPAERRQMGRLLEEALEQGAWGFSTGLEYAQERGASEEEVAALCELSARHGGIYATHTRERDAGAPAAVAEAIRVAESSDARLQVSHLIPRSGTAESEACLALIDEATAAGVDLAFDMHTRLYGTTFLQAALPPDLLASPPTLLASALADRGVLERVAAHRSMLSAGGDWARIVLLDNAVRPEYGRRDLAAIAAERGERPTDTICALLREALPRPEQLMVLNHCHSEDQQVTAFSHPRCMPGSDATTLAPDGPLASSVFHGAYTWAAWYYRFTVRERHVLAPEEAIHRLSGLPAERLGLSDRGCLRIGAAADVVVFDGDALTEQGSTFAPNRLASGVRHVLVNGVIALRDGVLSEERAGEVLRRP